MNTPDTKSAIAERFLARFESLSNSADAAASAALFADVFIAAGPSGAQAVKASDFALALPKRKQLFDSLGLRAARLVSADMRPLDDRYVLADTRWQMTFAPGGQEEAQILAESVFLLD